jgi:tetratricopeptide (TPR) repeat protein
MPGDEFIASMVANLNYWRQQTAELDDAAIARLERERENLFRAVQLGLRVELTVAAAAELARQCFRFVERRGYWQEWTAILQHASQAYRPQLSPLRCILLYQLGHLYRLLHRLPEAIDTHQQAGRLAEALQDEWRLAQAWSGLCLDFYHARRYEAAEVYGLKTLALLDKVANPVRSPSEGPSQASDRSVWQAATLNTLGLLARDMGQADTAQERLAQAVDLWRKGGDRTELARSLNNLATVWQAGGKLVEALAAYQEAAALLEPTASELDKVMVQISLGSLYYTMDRLEEAEALFRQANSPFLRQSSQIYYRALVNHNLGNVLLDRKQPVEAEAYLRAAVTLWPQAGDDVLHANTLGALAELKVAQGEKQKAIACYDEAITLLRRHPESAWGRQKLAQFEAERRTLYEP